MQSINRPIVPVLAQRGVFVPEVGGHLQVHLPGEIVRALVEEMTSRDVAVVRLVSIVLGKSGHQYKRDDIIACQRVIDELGTEIWAPIDRREVEMRENARRLANLAATEAREAEPIPVEVIPAAAAPALDEPVSDPLMESTPVTRLAHHRAKRKADR